MRRSFFSRSGGFSILFVALLIAFPFPAARAKAPKVLDLTDTVLSNRIMTKFALLLRASGLESFYSSRGPFTLFVPTDSAFSKLPPAEFAALLQPENKDTVQRIILFHLVNGKRLDAKDLLAVKVLPSCEGNPLHLGVSRSGDQTVNRAKILRADMHSLNGLVDEIDTVLIPPGISLTALAAVAPAPETNAVSTPAAPSDQTVGPETPPADNIIPGPATPAPADASTQASPTNASP